MNDDTPRYIWLGLGLLVVVVAALYARALGFGMTASYDDPNYLLFRPEVQNWWGVSWRQRLLTPKTGYPTVIPTFIYYHLRMVSSSMPSYFQSLHALNLGLHLSNIVIVFLLLRRWSSSHVAFIATALWALHPLNVEVTVWLTNLKTVLWGTCMLGGLLLWSIRLARSQREGSTWRFDAGIGLLFVIGVGCRPEMILLPLVLAVVSMYQRRSWRIPRDHFPLLGMLGGLSAAYLPLAVSGQESLVENVGAGSSHVWTKYYRFTCALELAARHYVVPISLDPEYYITYPGSWLETIPGLVIVLGLGCLMLGLALRRQIELLFPLIMGALFYGPYSQLKQLPRLTSDSYFYLPILMVTYFLVLAGYRYLQSTFDQGPRHQWALRVGAGVALVASLLFAGLTHQQVGRWRNVLALWGPVWQENSTVWRPYFHVARGLTKMGEWSQAREVLERGLPIFRKSRRYPHLLPEVYDHLGETQRAIDFAYEILQRHESPKPSHYVTYLELMAEHDISLNVEDDEVVTHTRRALEYFMTNRYWAYRPDKSVDVVAYASKYELTAPVADTLSREFQREQPHCLAWRLVGELPDETRRSLDVPPRPERCQTQQGPRDEEANGEHNP